MQLKFDFSEVESFTAKLKDQVIRREFFKGIIRKLADELKMMLKNNTPVKTGELQKGWDANNRPSYLVEEINNGYRITLYNQVPYAKYVNDGHYSYNQYGGPYIVKNRTVTYTQGNNDTTFVYGHFFVEKSIIYMEDTLERKVAKELEKYWERMLNGK